MLSELFPEMYPPRHQIVDLESDWFASLWLQEFRHDSARTEPVIAVVRELVATLRDEQIPAPQALRALRRAVSLLSVLAGTSRQVDRDGVYISDEVERSRHLGREVVSPPTESTRFAKAWLLGSPAEAIRTEPVIAIVDNLLDDLIIEKPAAGHASLRQAVQVLKVFAREDDSTTGIARPADSIIK